MKRILLLLSLSLLACTWDFGQEVPPAGNASKTAAELRPGELAREVRCAANAEQSYALYLPKNYTASRKWPVVYAFDPAARGSVPLELMKDAAEKYGFILAGSNNSRNGPWKLEGEAAQAVVQDVHARLAIDNRRSYFAGFSGGARVAASIAQACQCAAGVLLNGGGFPQGALLSREAAFPVFAAVGTYDFNYAEVVQLDEKLQGLGFPHFLRRFEGPHQWAPAAVMEEALAWFRLVAMKDGREARDDAFVAAQASQAVERAVTGAIRRSLRRLEGIPPGGANIRGAYGKRRAAGSCGSIGERKSGPGRRKTRGARVRGAAGAYGGDLRGTGGAGAELRGPVGGATPGGAADPGAPWAGGA